MQLLALLIVTLVTGFISIQVSEHICHCRIRHIYRYVYSGLIFDLLILVIMLFGLRFCKGVHYFTDLWSDLNCLSFFSKFAILYIIIAVILGILSGLLCKCLKKCHCGFRE